jgi:hypothetical protein
MPTITSANSQFALTIDALGISQAPIQGYATDDAFTQEAFEVTETRQGVDGVLSAGFTPNPKKLTVVLQADSPSIDIFDQWIAGQQAAKEAFEASAVITIPSIGKAYAFTTGWLRNVQAMPSGKKVLEPQTYTIEWQQIDVVPV